MPKLPCIAVLLAFGLSAHAGAPMGGAPIKATAPKASASAAKAAGPDEPKKVDDKKGAAKK